MSKRYFEFSEGTSNKFWEVWVEGTKVLTRYGKIGASGQTTVKDEGSPAGAQKLHDKLVGEKMKKGYEEKGGGGAAPAPAPAKVAVKKEAAPAASPPPAPAAKKAPVQVEEGFRRFEFVEGGSSKFWEVKVEDSEQTIRFGKIGTAGQEKVKDFDSPSEAKADTKKLIAEKTGKGYLEVGGKPKPASNPELEAAIFAKPDDVAGYLVYADWLQSNGDAHGEFVMLHQKDPKGALKKHKKLVLGDLAEFPTGQDYGRSLNIEWQHGFMKNVRMSWEGFDDGDGGDAADELGQLLDLPAARFIQSLRVGPFPSDDEMDLQPLLDVLEEKKAPAGLRELYLGDLGDWDISGTYSGKFGPLASVFPKLESLTLHAGHHDFGKNVSLPELKVLKLQSGGLGKDVLKDVMSAKLPKLESLDIWFGSDNYGGNITLKDIAPILSGVAFPHLKHLGLMNCEFIDKIIPELIKSKILPKLKSLDLSMGCLGDADIDLMMQNAAAFAHLEELNVEDSALTNASKPKVAKLAKKANFGKAHDPDRREGDYRYVSVSE